LKSRHSHGIIYTDVYKEITMNNRTIAQQLLDVAHSLENARASLYRVQAYRRAAQTILGLDREVEQLVADDGRKALRQLPGIGASLSVKIETLVRTGDIANLKESHRRFVAKA
jgi:DNA polymerase (family X)